MKQESNIRNVSVILPVYNGSAFLKECIESIINQSHPLLELIIVNDGSTDNSELIINEYEEVNKINIQNSGVAAARNIGIRASKGEWICFIDQDDIWTPDSLSDRIELLNQINDAKIVIGKQKWFLDGLDQIPSWVKPEQMSEELDGYLLGCAMIKKELFETYGYFDESYRFCSDFDWFFRLKDDDITFNQVDSTVLKKRVHSNNESRHTEILHKELSKAIFSSIKRKRSKQP